MSTRGWEDVKPSDLQRMHSAPEGPKPAAKSKYKNQRVMVDGFNFDSRHEADIWVLLRSREKLGDIYDLQRQVPWSLYVPVLVDGKPSGMVVEVARYVCDFQFRESAGNKLVVIDAKGQKKRICPYPLKAKMMNAIYGITITEV